MSVRSVSVEMPEGCKRLMLTGGVFVFKEEQVMKSLLLRSDKQYLYIHLQQSSAEL